MYNRWSEFHTAIESGESDRVNDVVDEIKDMGLEERIELFDVCFDELTDMYAVADDGYVRQSIVRVAEQLTPGLPTVVALDNEDRSIGVSEADIRDQTDAICGFFIEAITDDDGRVRQSAKRGLKDVFRTYDALDDEETIEALARKLDEMASQTSGKQENHLREARDDAAFFLQSSIARLIEGFQDEFGDSLGSDL